MIAVESAGWRGVGAGLAAFLVGAACASTSARAQQPPPAQEKKPDPGAQAKEEPAPAPEDEPVRDEEQERSALEDSVFVDPRAVQATEGTFDELYRTARGNNNRIAIQKMARGEGRADPAAIDRHVKIAARDLTNHDNIAAVITPSEKPDFNRIKAIEAAGLDLYAPLEVPVESRDAGFQREYAAKLLEVAPPLLANHMIARTQIMLALSRLGDKSALNLLIAQVADPDQPAVLKSLAAEGIAAIARAQTLTPDEQARTAEALTAFLQDPGETFWPARVRALEALGAVRAISTIAQRDQAVMARAALEILADPAERPEVRAWAAWAIGMMDVPATYPQVNYTLLAYEFGRLAAALGDEILIAPPGRVQYLTALLVYQDFVGLDGNPAVRNSGLTKARSLGPHTSAVQRIHQLVKALAADCVTYTRAVAGQVEPARQAVASRLAELKAHLEKNPPTDLALVPGVPPLEVAGPVAAAPANAPPAAQ